jgi:hypothetical protein
MVHQFLVTVKSKNSIIAIAEMITKDIGSNEGSKPPDEHLSVELVTVQPIAKSKSQHKYKDFEYEGAPNE